MSTLLFGLELHGVKARLWTRGPGNLEPSSEAAWYETFSDPDPNGGSSVEFQGVPNRACVVYFTKAGYKPMTWPAEGTSLPVDGAIELRMEKDDGHAPPSPETGFIGTYQNAGNLLYGFADDKGPWQLRGYSAHLLPCCVLKGEDIRPFIRRALDYGANTLVTIGTHLSPWKNDNGYHFDPRTNAAKDALNRMFDIGAEEGIRFAHAVAADFQYGLSDDDKRRIWNEQCDLMSGRWNLFARCGNESNVNGWHPEMFERRDLHGVLQSAGSAGIGNPPHQAYRDFSEWEGRRTPDSGWHKCLDDAGAGMYEQLVGYGDQHAIPVPTIFVEGQFYADTDPDHVGDRRSTDAGKALQYGLQIGASCAGGAVGTSLGLEGKQDGPVAEACARAQLRGMHAAFLR